MGGARNVGVKSRTLERFLNVEKLLKDEPNITLSRALERFDLPVSTYYRLRGRMTKPLRLWTFVYGSQFIELFEKAMVRSLSFPVNKEALQEREAVWEIWAKEAEFPKIEQVAKSVGIEIELHAADQFLSDLNSKYLGDRGVMMLEMFKISITRCIETDSQMLMAPPDSIFGGDSIPNILQAGEMPGTVVFVVHIRVLPTILADIDAQANRFGPASSIGNAKLVSIAMRNAHKAFQEAEYGAERINSYIGGIFWRKRPNGLYAVQHRLPTAYLINWTKADIEFFGRKNPPGQWPPVFGEYDHLWPSVCVYPQERGRLIGSSDDAFIVEITDPEANVPALMNYSHEEADRFWRNNQHNSTNRAFCVTLREEA